MLKRLVYKGYIDFRYVNMYIYYAGGGIKKAVILKMLPERLFFLSKFDNFYNGLVLDLKENKYNEQEFYLILTSKIKAMDRERREKRERLIKLNNEADNILVR